jgi:membrane-associated phospholipid phosphatase
MTRLAAIDRWTLAYVAIVSVALAWRWPSGPSGREALIVAHLLLVTVAVVAPRAREAGPVGQFLGDWYPIILLTALYAEIGLLNLAGGLVHDPLVQRWEAALFGAQPSREWIRAQPHWWISWPLHLAYLSYYPAVLGAPLALWASGRRASARLTILLTMVAFYVCYVVFLFFPVAGPRYAFALAGNEAAQSGIAVFTQQLLDGGDSWGAAFPSSHVAAALTASVSAGWGWRPLGWILVPMSVLLVFGTVYGQYHYAVDAVAGVGLAVVILRVGRPRGVGTGR